MLVVTLNGSHQDCILFVCSQADRGFAAQVAGHVHCSLVVWLGLLCCDHGVFRTTATGILCLFM